MNVGLFSLLGSLIGGIGDKVLEFIVVPLSILLYSYNICGCTHFCLPLLLINPLAHGEGDMSLVEKVKI